MKFLAPSANRLPAEPEDLRPDQFRLFGRTYEDGGLKFFERRYFVGEREVFFHRYTYDTTTATIRRIAEFGDEKWYVAGWNHVIEIDGAQYFNGEDTYKLEVARDERQLKFSLKR